MKILNNLNQWWLNLLQRPWNGIKTVWLSKRQMMKWLDIWNRNEFSQKDKGIMRWLSKNLNVKDRVWMFQKRKFFITAKFKMFNMTGQLLMILNWILITWLTNKTITHLPNTKVFYSEWCLRSLCTLKTKKSVSIHLYSTT